MFVDVPGLPSERHDASGHVMLSRSERDAYNDFVQGLMSNIRCRDFDSSITTDTSKIENGLGEQEVDNFDSHILRSQKQDARPENDAGALVPDRIVREALFGTEKSRRNRSSDPASQNPEVFLSEAILDHQNHFSNRYTRNPKEDCTTSLSGTSLITRLIVALSSRRSSLALSLLVPLGTMRM